MGQGRFLFCILRFKILKHVCMSAFFFFFYFWPFSAACGIFVPQPGIRPESPALEGGFLTTGPPGKSHHQLFDRENNLFYLCFCWRIVVHLLFIIFSVQILYMFAKYMQEHLIFIGTTVNGIILNFC